MFIYICRNALKFYKIVTDEDNAILVIFNWLNGTKETKGIFKLISRNQTGNTDEKRKETKWETTVHITYHWNLATKATT